MQTESSKALSHLGVSNLAWPEEAMTDALTLLARYGVAGVEVAPTRVASWNELTPQKLRDYRQRVEDRGFTIPSLQAILFGKSELQWFGSDIIFTQFIDHLKRVAEIANDLGAKTLVFGAPKNRLNWGADQSQLMGLIEKRLPPVSDIMMEAGVCLVLEPVPAAYGGEVLSSANAIIQALQSVECQGLGLHLDTGCALLGNEDIAAVIALHTPRHFHIAEPQLAGFTHPRSKHFEASIALRSIQYKRWCVIEMLACPRWAEELQIALQFVNSCYYPMPVGVNS